MDPTAITTSGPLLLATGVAPLAGMVSIAPMWSPWPPATSPTWPPLVRANTPDEKGKKARVLGAVTLFVLGFTVVFAAGSAAVGRMAARVLCVFHIMLAGSVNRAILA